MKTTHLSELQIQQYALDKSGCETDVSEHLNACEKCKAGVAAYQSLFSAIEAQPNAVFDFDLTSLVLAQVPEPKPAFSRTVFAVYSVSFFSIAFSCLAFYLYSAYFLNLFSRLSTVILYLLIATAVTIILFESIADYKSYEHKIKALDFY